MGRRRPQAPRLGRARRLRDRAEDRRLRGLARLPGRKPRPRRDPRRRRARRGRHGQPAHDQGDPAPHARLGRPAAARPGGARRGLLPALGLQPPERAPRRRGQEDRPEPAQRGRRLAAPAQPADHGRARPVHLGLRHRPERRGRARHPLGDARMAARARLPREPAREAPRVARVGRARVRGVGGEAHRARLRDRRHRHQGGLPRPAAAPRRAARAAALGARVQVGADDRADEAPEDPRARRPHRGAQPVGAARARGGRRRHRLPGDAAQRGGHQPQGHPRGRHRHRPARRRRDPAGGRAGAAAREGDAAVPHACEVPALRRRRSSSPRAR